MSCAKPSKEDAAIIAILPAGRLGNTDVLPIGLIAPAPFQGRVDGGTMRP